MGSMIFTCYDSSPMQPWACSALLHLDKTAQDQTGKEAVWVGVFWCLHISLNHLQKGKFTENYYGTWWWSWSVIYWTEPEIWRNGDKWQGHYWRNCINDALFIEVSQADEEIVKDEGEVDDTLFIAASQAYEETNVMSWVNWYTSRPIKRPPAPCNGRELPGGLIYKEDCCGYSPATDLPIRLCHIATGYETNPEVFKGDSPRWEKS